MIDLQTWPRVITAIGALGTAAFGLVDATKVFGGGVNHIGFKGIRNAILALTPGTPGSAGTPANALPQKKILATLQANWFNGVDLSSQKAAAKSLIKLYLNPGNAAEMAKAAGVDGNVLTQVAMKIAAGETLNATETDVYARFDLILTALLDEAYQRSDQTYRNGTRAWAVVASLLLALAGSVMLHTTGKWGVDIGEALLVGLLATPLAPIAKNLSSALATSVNTLQAIKK
ncbi:MAG: hypothetical protein WB524_13560 [Acidobacteriaceae bacterium]